MGDQVERKLTAILAADIAGYSRLMAGDEEGTLTRLKSHRRELIDPKIKEYRGRIIKTTGDGMLVEFASVVDAVRCAVDIQRGMAGRNEDVTPDRRIDFRVGINIGDVIVDGDDIYGDGVNIAARLENIAEPGGIRVSANVRDQVLDKLGFGFDDLGEQSVKNIPRPVRVYRVQLGDREAQTASVAPARSPGQAGGGAQGRGASAQDKRATPANAGVHSADAESSTAMDTGFRRYGAVFVGGIAALIVLAAVGAWLGGKYMNPSPPLGEERVLTRTQSGGAGEVGRSAAQQPTSPALSSLKGGEEKETESARHLSIVVLPFTNLSGDPAQDYFADGITENLTTDLSRIRNSFVIARNTAFTFKGKNIDAKEIGKELGVRYVLEGSVQRDQNRVRVNAQLIDAESGAHLWADRFENERADLFDMQDEIVTRVARSLDVEIASFEAELRARARPINPDADDLALECQAAYYRDPSTTDPKKAALVYAPCEAALKLDPNNLTALCVEAFVRLRILNTNNSADRNADSRRSEELTARAVAIAPDDAAVLNVQASLFYLQDRMEESIAAAERALISNPSYIPAYQALGFSELRLGRYEKAIEVASKAIRLSPRDPLIYAFHWFNAWAYFSLHDDAKAKEWSDVALATAPSYPYPLMTRIPLLLSQGREAEAKEAYRRFVTGTGSSYHTIAAVRASFTRTWPAADAASSAAKERILQAFKQVGMPEDEGPRLSIVVLPFSNLSGDASQDYLADVLTDELTTYISRIPDSFVIARNTAFTYKGKPTDVKQIGKDLGVRYALEGSVQPTATRIRTNAQLIDTETGAHLWAEEFDTDKTDLLQTEDEIVTRLARTLQLQMNEIEAAKLQRAHPDNPDAQELAMRCQVAIWSTGPYGKQADAGFHFCEQALEIDPNNVVALATLSHKFFSRVLTAQSLDRQADIKRADELASHALALDPNNPDAHSGKAGVLSALKQFEESRAEAERALALNPSQMDAYLELGNVELWTGQPENVIARADKAVQLSPLDPGRFGLFAIKGAAYLMLRQDDQAIEWFRRTLAINPNYGYAQAYLTAALALAGRESEARDALARYVSMPGTQTKTITAFKKQTTSDNPAYLALRERLYQGLRQAGLPEE